MRSIVLAAVCACALASAPLASKPHSQLLDIDAHCEEADVSRAASLIGDKTKSSVQRDIELLLKFTNDIQSRTRHDGVSSDGLHYVIARVRHFLPLYCLDLPKVSHRDNISYRAEFGEFSIDDQQKIDKISLQLAKRYPIEPYKTACSDCTITERWQVIYFYAIHMNKLKTYTSADASEIKRDFAKVHHDATLQTIYLVLHAL